MENISLDDFLYDGMIQEKKFRDKVKNIDWSKFSDESSSQNFEYCWCPN